MLVFLCFLFHLRAVCFYGTRCQILLLLLLWLFSMHSFVNEWDSQFLELTWVNLTYSDLSSCIGSEADVLLPLVAAYRLHQGDVPAQDLALVAQLAGVATVAPARAALAKPKMAFLHCNNLGGLLLSLLGQPSVAPKKRFNKKWRNCSILNRFKC